MNGGRQRAITLTILFAIVIAAAFVFHTLSPHAPAPSAPVTHPPVAQTPIGNPNTVTKVDLNNLPQGFPATVPLFVPAKVLDNYIAVGPNGKTQVTRTYVSLNSVDKAFSDYRIYLTNSKNGWTLLSPLSADPNHKAIFAKNANGILTINISAKGAGSVVEIDFTKW